LLHWAAEFKGPKESPLEGETNLSVVVKLSPNYHVKVPWDQTPHQVHHPNGSSITSPVHFSLLKEGRFQDIPR